MQLLHVTNCSQQRQYEVSLLIDLEEYIFVWEELCHSTELSQLHHGLLEVPYRH